MDNNFPTEEEIQQAIAAAVAAERRRVWDVLNREAQQPYKTDEETIVTDLIVKAGWYSGIDHAISILFPDGEPQPTTEDSSAIQHDNNG